MRTVVAVDPITYNNVGVVSDPNPATTKTFTNIPFGTGLAVLAITSQSNYATGVTVNGNAATLVRQQVRNGARGFQIWTCPVTAGNHSVVITVQAVLHCTLWNTTLVNVSSTPIAHDGSVSPSVDQASPAANAVTNCAVTRHCTRLDNGRRRGVDYASLHYGRRYVPCRRK